MFSYAKGGSIVEKVYSDKEIDSSFYNEKSLFLLNIKELRDLGRKFGVPAPTTMKKKDLVDYILKVVYGEVNVPIKSSVGRPSTREFDLNKCLKKIEKNVDVSGKLKSASFENFGTMKVASFEQTSEISNIETRIFSFEDGKYLLKVHQFVRSAKDFEISKEIADRFELKNFDVVEVIICDDMFKIVSINSKIVGGNLGEITICKSKLKGGTKRDFYLSTKEEIKDNIKDLSSKFENEQAKLVVLGTSEYTSKNTTSVVYDKDEDTDVLYKKLVHLIGFCENIIYKGDYFLLVFEDAEEIEKIINSFDENVTKRVKKYLNDALERFVKIGNIIVFFRCEKDKKY